MLHACDSGESFTFRTLDMLTKWQPLQETFLVIITYPFQLLSLCLSSFFCLKTLLFWSSRISYYQLNTSWSSHSEVFCWKAVLEICSKFTGEQSCQSAISIKLLWNFIEIVPQLGWSPVALLHIFRTTFPKNTSE